jgi:hypothetical protein
MSAIATLGSSVAMAAPSHAVSAHVGASCKLTAAAPTMANDQVTGTGSIRCKTSRTVHVHLETQALQFGQWGTFGSFDGYVQVRAGQTHHVSTGPANCRGFGNATMRTLLRVVPLRVRSHRALASVRSGAAEISCSGH